VQLKNTNDSNYEKPTVPYEINPFLFQLILRLSTLFEQQVLGFQEKKKLLTIKCVFDFVYNFCLKNFSF